MKYPAAFMAASLAVLPFGAAPAQDPVAIAGSMAVSGVISDLKDSVTDVIESLDDTVSNSTFRTRQHLEVLLGQLDVLAQGTIDKTFDELNAVERQTFIDVRSQIDRIAELERVTADDAERVVLTTSTGLTNLPFAKGTPLVTGFTPGYVRNTSTNPDGAVDVRVKGIRLGYKNPQFSVGRASCKRVIKTETNLVFRCPKKLFRANDQVNPVAGKLTVFEKPGFWRRLRSWFRAKPLPREYDLSVYAVPKKMGTYSLSAIVSQDTVQTESRSQSFSHHNDHCQGRRNKLFAFNVTPGWKIDMQSVAPKCDASSKSRCQGLRNVTATSFGYMGTITNRGKCVKVLGKVVAKDARGSVRGHVNWKEYRTETNDVETQLATGTLDWGEDERLVLPEGTKAIILTIDQIDGEKKVAVGTDSSNPWFDVTADVTARSVIIKPKSLQVALGQ